MLFIQGEFFSQAVADIRSRKVLNAASHFPAKIIDPGDLLAAVIQEGGHEIRVLFTSALHPRRLWEDLPLPDIDQEKQTGPAGERRRADGFSPSAKAALNEWETLLVDYQQEANAVALELLVLCLLRQFDRSLRQKWEALDFGALGDALEKRVSRLLGKPSSGETDGNQENERINEFSANIEILNLTRQARDMEGDHASPFDTEPDYEHFFDGLSRGLCRDTTRHVLVIAEKGVGVAALLAEFARKGSMARRPCSKKKPCCCSIAGSLPGLALKTYCTRPCCRSKRRKTSFSAWKGWRGFLIHRRQAPTSGCCWGCFTSFGAGLSAL